jgi:hypothetical protein
MSITPLDLQDGSGGAWEQTLRQAVRALRYGSVEVVVHDGRVVQIETREKVRFADRRPPDDRKRGEETQGRADRSSGGAGQSAPGESE